MLRKQVNEELMIHESWKRCHSIGLDPFNQLEDVVIEAQLFENVIEKNREFLHHAIPVLESFFPHKNQMSQVVVLTDKDGIVIHAIGNPELLHLAKSIHLRLGANWNERSMGTNAISVSLIERRPVQVRGNQHFFASTHFLACSASPIHTPTGELIGAINISSRLEDHLPFNLSIACMAAEIIQNKFLMEHYQSERQILLKEIDFATNNISFPLLSLDKDDRIIRANQAARRLLGNQCVGETLSKKAHFQFEKIHDNFNRLWGSLAINKYHNQTKGKDRLHTFQDVAGQCRKIIESKDLAKKASHTTLPILLNGESGTGKELIAQSIHSYGPRRDGPFIAINCSAIPESLIESEWFGYEPGSFTGASSKGSKGKFEAASGGTIFLDEIGDMSLRAQAALLRVLQEKEITPVGSTKSKPIDVNIISATHRNLIHEINAGRFRADLYYRLKGIQINLPALRDRQDLIYLVEVLLEKMGYHDKSISKCAEEKLSSHSWPGNIRELNNVLMQASFLAEGKQISGKHILFERGLNESYEDQIHQTTTLEANEIVTIKKVLQTTNWNISKAAKLLRIGRSTLYRKINEYDIHPF